MPAPPRILHIHFGKDGGAERFFVGLAQGFARRGVEQRFVIRPNRSWRGELAPLGPILEDHGRPLSPRSWLLPWRIARLCRTWEPDAVMAWMPRAARLMPRHGGALRFCRLGDFPQHLRHFGRCDLLVGNVPAIGAHVRGLGWTRPCATISNFVRPVAVRPVDRAALDTPADAFVIAGGGRFVPRKGLDLLVRAAAAVPGAWLWLVGDGTERAALERLVDETGMRARTRFTGWLAEPIHHFAAADLLAVPSRHEPFGNIVIEGWAAGVPVVSSRSEGPSWYMRDGENGLLCAIDDAEGLALAIRRLRDDPGLRRRLVEGGRAMLAGPFSEERIVDRYLRLIADPQAVLADPDAI
jgi:glycosyltransferase involved in cell wall biosynthesis